MNKPKINSLYDRQEPRQYAFTTVGESKTQLQFKEESDINNILAKYKQTGQISHINPHQPITGDFSNALDYQTALHKIKHAQDTFFSLPSKIRNKFSNDPSQLISYLEDKENHAEAIKLGLINEPKTIQPTIQQSFENALENHSKKQSKKSNDT